MATRVSSEETKSAILDTVRNFGYASEKEFIKDAMRRRLLELKKIDFLVKARAIREKLTKKGLKEDDILRDFDKFYHHQ